MTDYERLLAHFSDPERNKAITGAPGFNPRKAIWLSDDNIRAMSRDAYFMGVFNAQDEGRDLELLADLEYAEFAADQGDDKP